MASVVERCHCIRTVDVEDYDMVDLFNEVFASMERSWPGATFKSLSVTTRPIPDEDAFLVDLTFEAVHP
jgi:hypothetical protein